MGGKQLPLHMSRILTVFLGFLVTVAALAAPMLGDNLIDIINAIAGTLLGSLLAVFLLGMFSWRANSPGVVIGLGAGAISLAAVVSLTDVPRWWYGGFTIVPTLLVGAVASRWFQPPSSSQVPADNLLVPKLVVSRSRKG
jgi:Na+/pantothenate symporter